MPPGATLRAKATVSAPRLAPMSTTWSPGCNACAMTVNSASVHSPYSMSEREMKVSLLSTTIWPCFVSVISIMAVLQVARAQDDAATFP